MYSRGLLYWKLQVNQNYSSTNMITSFRKEFSVLILGNVPDWKCRIYAKEINWLLAEKVEF